MSEHRRAVLALAASGLTKRGPASPDPNLTYCVQSISSASAVELAE